MEYLRIENDFPRISHSAVTLGKFDGIHRGHQKLVEKIIEQKQEGAQAVVLALGTASRTILTKEERCRILEEMGVDILLECPLTEKIRHMKAENFIKFACSIVDKPYFHHLPLSFNLGLSRSSLFLTQQTPVQNPRTGVCHPHFSIFSPIKHSRKFHDFSPFPGQKPPHIVVICTFLSKYHKCHPYH